MTILPPLDTPSLLVMSIVATAAMALALAVMRPRRGEGQGLWALALAAYALTCVLVLMRELAPMASIVLSNTAMTVTLALVLGAIAQFHGRPMPRWPNGAAIIATVAASLAYWDSYPPRLAVTSTLWAAQLALAVWALWRPQAPAQRRGAVLMSTALLVQCVLMLARALWFTGHPMPPGGFLHGDHVSTLALIASHAVLVLASMGFVLLAKDRADAANLHLASNDALTGIANRRLILQTLARDVARAVRHRQPYAVLMVDIDHFKEVNDRLGHLGGDEVLCHVARLLRQHLRTQDLAGRWGGEEFLLLLPDTSATGAQIVAEKLRQWVEKSPCTYHGETIRMTISVGRCAEELEPGDEPEHLIEAADRALYAAKHDGRNRVESAPLARLHALSGARAMPGRVV